MLKDLLTLDINFSESHLVFPRITLIILAILGSAIIIQNVMKRRKEGKGKKFKFFIENYDKFKFYGTVATLIGYIFLLELVGFLIATIIFIFVTNTLFMGNVKRKTLIISAINSVVTSFIVWFVFGYLIDITLP